MKHGEIKTVSSDILIDEHLIFVRRIILNENAEADCMVFLHDAWGCVDLWGDFPEKLAVATSCNAILYDRQGFGKSAAEQKELRTPEYFHKEANELLKILDFFQIKKSYLFGHSDGASIALLAAALQPERFAGLIAESPHTFIEQSGRDAVKITAEKAQKTNLLESLRKYHGSKADTLFRQWQESWNCDCFDHWEIISTLKKVECPVLALRGEYDIFDTHDQLYKLKHGLTCPVEIIVIPNAQHSPHKEARELTFDICRSWFKKTK